MQKSLLPYMCIHRLLSYFITVTLLSCICDSLVKVSPAVLHGRKSRRTRIYQETAASHLGWFQALWTSLLHRLRRYIQRSLHPEKPIPPLSARYYAWRCFSFSDGSTEASTCSVMSSLTPFRQATHMNAMTTNGIILDQARRYA